MVVCDWEIDDNDGSSVSLDGIATQLAAIAAKLDTIVSQLRGDVAEIKSVMFGAPLQRNNQGLVKEESSDGDPNIDDRSLGVQSKIRDDVQLKIEDDVQLKIEDDVQLKIGDDVQLKIGDDVQLKIIDGGQAAIVGEDQRNCSTGVLTKNQIGRLKPRFFGLHGSISEIGPIFYEPSNPLSTSIHCITHVTTFTLTQGSDKATMAWLIAWHIGQQLLDFRLEDKSFHRLGCIDTYPVIDEN